MKKDDVSGLTRRRFFHTLTPVAAGCLGVPCLGKRLFAQDKPGFWSEYSPEEQRAVDSSVMAQDMTNFAGHGFGCAECSLGVGLNYLGEPQEKLASAAVFSGGFGKGDLCGFFTGAMMSIGIAANVDRHARARQIAESGLAMGVVYVADHSERRTTYGEGPASIQIGRPTIRFYE